MRRYIVILAVLFGFLTFQTLYALETHTTTAKPLTMKEQLQDTSWTLVSMNGKDVTFSWNLDFSRYFFSAKVCNNINWNFHVIQRTFIIRNTISTMMFCENGSMDVEYALTHANHAKLILTWDLLTMTTRNKNIIVWKKR